MIVDRWPQKSRDCTQNEKNRTLTWNSFGRARVWMTTIFLVSGGSLTMMQSNWREKKYWVLRGSRRGSRRGSIKGGPRFVPTHNERCFAESRCHEDGYVMTKQLLTQPEAIAAYRKAIMGTSIYRYPADYMRVTNVFYKWISICLKSLV